MVVKSSGVSVHQGETARDAETLKGLMHKISFTALTLGSGRERAECTRGCNWAAWSLAACCHV